MLKIRSDKKASICIAHYDSVKRFWISEGWWKINAGATVTVINKPLDQKSYYVNGWTEGYYSLESNDTKKFYRYRSSEENFIIERADQESFWKPHYIDHFIRISVSGSSDYTYSLVWKPYTPTMNYFIGG